MSQQDGYVRSGSPYESAYGFCRARRVGDRIEVAGTAPVPPKGEGVAGTAHDQLLFGEAEPVATMVVIAALLDPAWKVELEVAAARPA